MEHFVRYFLFFICLFYALAWILLETRTKYCIKVVGWPNRRGWTREGWGKSISRDDLAKTRSTKF